MHYGLTEASRSAFIEFHTDAAYLDSIGRPSPNVEMRVVSDNGRLAETGDVGRVQVKGATVMRGYWRDEPLTARALRPDGWLETNDYGHEDAEGYYYLDGRREDVVNVAGKKVYPATVEQAACRHSSVKECACIAIPDPRGITGESPALFVVAAPEHVFDAAVLTDFLAKELEAHAVPQVITLVDSIPKTPTGKIIRARLRELSASD
jgi:long-chain acyl-CoA synthetase